MCRIVQKPSHKLYPVSKYLRKIADYDRREGRRFFTNYANRLDLLRHSIPPISLILFYPSFMFYFLGTIGSTKLKSLSIVHKVYGNLPGFCFHADESGLRHWKKIHFFQVFLQKNHDVWGKIFQIYSHAKKNVNCICLMDLP